MAYNLRTRRRIEELLKNEESGEEVFEQPDDASSSSNSEASSAGEEDSDVEMEDVSLNKRLNNSRARRRPITKLQGKNGFCWDTTFSSRRSDRLSEILPEIVLGPAGDAEHACTIEEFWSCLFDENMIDILVQNTNKKIEQESLELVAEDRIESYHHHTDEIEIKAFIGLLYYTGLWKSTSINDNRLWDKKNGITFYRCMFSRSRFTFLTKCLRFDDSETRNKNDRFAAIRSFWDIFIKNYKTNYTPSNQCTVDEQLLSFRERCLFRVYMKDKPDKYGLKIISLNDAKTAYMINAVPYLGKSTEITERDETIPEYYFRNKVVLIVSSHMQTRNITDQKPDIVRYYNLNKGGTDTFDKLCHSYTTAGRTSRWPMRYFLGILDQAIVNARILYACKLKNDDKSHKVTAIECLEKLHLFLAKAYLERRYATVTLRLDVRLGIAGILNKDVKGSNSLMNVDLEAPQRCVSCTRKEDRKSRKGCSSCKRPICSYHRFILCNDCSGN
ncbi:hypothetical protein TKK_0012255 [Trichogramma kaykai]